MSEIRDHKTSNPDRTYDEGCNAGFMNTGRCNDGNMNTGRKNEGHMNTGDCNVGNLNVGNGNVGDCNVGNSNVGSGNTGNHNEGRYNTGDWNRSSFNTGCFNTEPQKITLFNKPSDMTYMQWHESEARFLLDQMPRYATSWIRSEDMTDEERAAHPTHEITGGYIKVIDKFECEQQWWDELSDCAREIIKAIPNFDAEIFRQCTGIKVDQ